MGYIEEVMIIANDINQIKYSTSNPFKKLSCKYYTLKLKKSINKINDYELTTKMISEYADYLLEIFKIYSDKKHHIKQILKGQYENAGSITFEFELSDDFIGSVTVNFIDRYSTLADYIFNIYGPNSSSQFNYTERNIPNYIVEKQPDDYINSIGKNNIEKLNHLRYVFVTEITKEIKEFLLSSLKVKEIS